MPTDDDIPKVGFQHDADPNLDDRTFDDRPLEDIFAEAVHPDEYVLSSPEAMESALRQQAAMDAEQES